MLGEYNRHIESGTEQRISIEKIVMHDKYHNFQNDLGNYNIINKKLKKIKNKVTY